MKYTFAFTLGVFITSLGFGLAHDSLWPAAIGAGGVILVAILNYSRKVRDIMKWLPLLLLPVLSSAQSTWKMQMYAGDQPSTQTTLVYNADLLSDDTGKVSIGWDRIWGTNASSTRDVSTLPFEVNTTSSEVTCTALKSTRLEHNRLRRNGNTARIVSIVITVVEDAQGDLIGLYYWSPPDRDNESGVMITLERL